MQGLVRYLEVVGAVKVAAVAHELRLFAADLVPAVHLMLVDGNAGHISTGGANYASEWAANTASHVEHAVAILDVQLRCNPVLRVQHGYAVRLVPSAEAEVERIAPAVLVEVAGEVVE